MLTFKDQERAIVNYMRRLTDELGGRVCNNHIIITYDPEELIARLNKDRIFGFSRHQYKIIINPIGVEAATEKWEQHIKELGLL